MIASIGIPSLLLGFLELCLCLIGFGYSTNFFVPAGDGTNLTTNPKFAWPFQPPATASRPIPTLFPKQKAPGTFRIFVLGESAAAGTPDPAFGFARITEVMLEQQDPEKHFEVINSAMRGIDSFSVRCIADECAQLSPDLFIIYMGNNDMIGLHAPVPKEIRVSGNIHWLRFQDALRRSKLAQLWQRVLGGFGKAREKKKQEMEYLRRQRLAFDDPRRAAVYRNFEINLRHICRSAERAGARTLLCSVQSNLRDFPPLGSLHRGGLGAERLARWEREYGAGAAAETQGDWAAALRAYESAETMDDHFAELSYRMARCAERLEKKEVARAKFCQARDRDALKFRADSRVNSINRKIAAESWANLKLVDLDRALAESSLADGGIPGKRIFHDHAHFTFDGDYLVASILAAEIGNILQLPQAAQILPSRDECARRLAYTPIEELNVKQAFARLLSNPPFLDQVDHEAQLARLQREVAARQRQITTSDFHDAIRIYQQALAGRPDDWMLHNNFGNLLNQFGQYTSAANEYERVVKQFPKQWVFRMMLGNALRAAGRAADAAREFAAAAKLNPYL